MKEQNKFVRVMIYIIIGLFIFGMLIGPFLR